MLVREIHPPDPADSRLGSPAAECGDSSNISPVKELLGRGLVAKIGGVMVN